MDKQIQNGSAVVPRLEALIEVAVEVTGFLAAKAVVKPAAGPQIAVLRAKAHDQDSVVLPQLQDPGPFPGGVLQIPRVLRQRYHRQNAVAQLVPVGVVKAQAFFRLRGKNPRPVFNVPLKGGGGEAAVKGRAPHLRLRGPGRLPRLPQANARQDGQDHKGRCHRAFP